MAERICPWWIGYLLACPLRRLFQDPADIVAPYVREGMIAFEPGPGMGFFTLELARRVGGTGRVIVADIQLKMLERLERRAGKAGLRDRLVVRLSRSDSMNVDDLASQADFALCFAVVHEMPNVDSFFTQTARVLKPGGKLLLAEPPGHVKSAVFDAELAAAARAGLEVMDRPAIPRSHAALLRRTKIIIPQANVHPIVTEGVEDGGLTVATVFKTLFRQPGRMLVSQWNWKSAITSSLFRSHVFLLANWSAGPSAAGGAMATEFGYRFLAAGFYGALTQSFRRVEPPWTAVLTVSLLLPGVSHSLELILHWMRGTPNLRLSMLSSICFTGVTTIFNWYAMRRGALLVGENSSPFAEDLRRTPGLLVDLFRDTARAFRLLVQ